MFLPTAGEKGFAEVVVVGGVPAHCHPLRGAGSLWVRVSPTLSPCPSPSPWLFLGTSKSVGACGRVCARCRSEPFHRE